MGFSKKIKVMKANVIHPRQEIDLQEDIRNACFYVLFVGQLGKGF